jgi:hypothetical protein
MNQVCDAAKVNASGRGFEFLSVIVCFEAKPCETKRNDEYSLKGVYSAALRFLSGIAAFE